MKYEAEADGNTIPFGVPVKTDTDSLCSGGKYVASIGNGRSITFNDVKVPESGTYAMTVYYMSDAPCTAYVKMNGNMDSWQEVSFVGTGGTSGGNLAHKTIWVDLDHTASNTVEIGNNSEYGPNIDRMTLSKYADGTTAIETPESAEPVGKVYALDKHIVIEQSSSTDYWVYNSLGQILKEGSFDGGRASLSVDEKGVYLVKVHTEDKVFTKKVLIGQ